MTLKNCTLVGNSANYGGAVSGTVTMINCTVTGNTASEGGGGIWYGNGSALLNTIVYGDTGGELASNSTATVTATYCDIEGGDAGPGNINANPLLSPLADNGGQTQTMSLGAGSPCYGAGTPIGATLTSPARSHRVPNPPSIGAFDN